jgi:uncharacterized protein
MILKMLNYFGDWLNALYDLSAEMAPYLLLGFLFAGILHVYIRPGQITRWLGPHSLKSALYAALIGIPLPLCSCGVIPTGIAFHRDGASGPATVSFLISTPQTGIDSILVTWSLLGWPMAVIRPVAALFTGILGGAFAIRKDGTERPDTEKMQQPVQQMVAGSPLKRMLHYAFIEFMEDIAKWLLIGLLLAAAMAVIIPDGFFTRYMSHPLLSMLVVLVASVPLYVCATGSVPVAAVLMMKGLSPGAALVLLMAGPATNIATITVIGKTLGRRNLFAYLIAIIAGSLVFGLLTNVFFSSVGIMQFMDHSHHDHAHHLLPEWLNLASLVILSFFMGVAILRKRGWLSRFNRKGAAPSDDHSAIQQIKVSGMTCNHCRSNVEEIIGRQPGVKGVEAEVSTGIVRVQAESINPEAWAAALSASGFKYEGEA